MGLAEGFVAGALAFVAVLSLFAAPADALSRSDGDYWVYEGSMDVEGVSVTGDFRYEFEKADSLTLGSDVHDVNVMKVTGSMSGATDDLLGVSATVGVVFDGHVYETSDGFGTVKEDMYMWTNMTLGTGSISLTVRIESQEVTTYSAPLFSGFDEEETGTGDAWEETTNVTHSSTTWVDDAVDDTSTDTYEATYSYSVAAAEDTVTTAAGTFDCLKITVTDDDGDYEIDWYSPDVGNYVKMSYYEMGDSTAYMSLELTEFSHSGNSGLMMMLVIGLVAVVVIVVILIALLMMRKRGRTPSQGPPQGPLPPSQ